MLPSKSAALAFATDRLNVLCSMLGRDLNESIREPAIVFGSFSEPPRCADAAVLARARASSTWCVQMPMEQLAPKSGHEDFADAGRSSRLCSKRSIVVIRTGLPCKGRISKPHMAKVCRLTAESDFQKCSIAASFGACAFVSVEKFDESEPP